MSEELEVLKIVARRLDKAGLPYMISGSMAANYYTVPRMTRDIDVVIELNEADADNFARVFQEDFYVDKEMVKHEVLRQGMFNVIHNQSVIKVDFIISKNMPFHRAAFSRRMKTRVDPASRVDNNSVWLITAEDLVLAKLLWAEDSHSEMQIKDIRNLLATVKGLDRAHIKAWVARLGLVEFYKEVANE